MRAPGEPSAVGAKEFSPGRKAWVQSFAPPALERVEHLFLKSLKGNSRPDGEMLSFAHRMRFDKLVLP
jgi:hypothetical protein